MPDDTRPDKEAEHATVQAFVARWERSGAAERANYQLFLSELCDIIGVPRPDPATADDSQNAYVFERSVVFQHGDGSTSLGCMDFYKRGCLTLEAKQGANEPAAAEPLSEAARDLKRKLKTGTARRGTVAWDDAMLRARGQAELYVRALPSSEGRIRWLRPEYQDAGNGKGNAASGKRQAGSEEEQRGLDIETGGPKRKNVQRPTPNVQRPTSK